MDDSILWDNQRSHLALKFRLFRQALGEWGLTVNPQKTVFYSSPYSTEDAKIELEGLVIQSSSTFEVMGVHLSVPLKPSALMDTGMAKARKKYFATRDVLECRGPLKKRIQVFQTTVGGAALWYASAATPTPQAMGALNTMQMEMVARMSRLKRKPEESWLEFRQRSIRAARQILHNTGTERWSTVWLPGKSCITPVRRDGARCGCEGTGNTEATWPERSTEKARRRAPLWMLSEP